MLCQFLILPFVGFVSSRIFRLGAVDATMLLVVVSSPGGAYSNLWSSLSNADLALSVTGQPRCQPYSLQRCCHSISSSTSAHRLAVACSRTYAGSLLTIGIVTAAVATGLGISWRLQCDGERGRRLPRRVEALRWRCNALGNAAGLALIAFSLVFSQRSDEPLWGKTTPFYVGVAAPTLVALAASLGLTSLPCLRLAPPERVAIAIECMYQNIGIAGSIAFSAFDGRDAARAKWPPRCSSTELCRRHCSRCSSRFAGRQGGRTRHQASRCCASCATATSRRRCRPSHIFRRAAGQTTRRL